MKQLTIMMIVPDVARADVMLTEDRVYYRFATEDTIEDGDLPGLKEDYGRVEKEIKEALEARQGENPVVPETLKLTVFVNNVKYNTGVITDQALKRMVDILCCINDTFNWMKGFVR